MADHPSAAGRQGYWSRTVGSQAIIDALLATALSRNEKNLEGVGRRRGSGFVNGSQRARRSMREKPPYVNLAWVMYSIKEQGAARSGLSMEEEGLYSRLFHAIVSGEKISTDTASACWTLRFDRRQYRRVLGKLMSRGIVSESNGSIVLATAEQAMVHAATRLSKTYAHGEDASREPGSLTEKFREVSRSSEKSREVPGHRAEVSRSVRDNRQNALQKQRASPSSLVSSSQEDTYGKGSGYARTRGDVPADEWQADDDGDMIPVDIEDVTG